MTQEKPRTLHIVVRSVGGFAREDSPVPSIAGAFTDEQLAQNVAKVTQSEVISVKLDVVPPGILELLQAFSFKLPEGFQD